MNSPAKTLSLNELSKNQNIVKSISKIKNNNGSNQTEKFAKLQKATKLKTSNSKDLNNFASLNSFKILEDKVVEDQENQHNEHKDLISHSACQSQNSDRVQSHVTVKKIYILQTKTY